MTVRLTQLAKRAGCAAKQPPGYLLPLLGRLPPVTDPRVLVGSAAADDAAVIKLRDDLALVFTTDFFTPIVDDPYHFGAIAAANALSDVYAMGGTPLSALNLVGFPDELLDVAVLGEILRGGAEKAKEAGIDVTGGHTIKSEEPIYGLAVTGTVHPDRVVTNAGGKPGDLLVLTKPIGTGIVTTAAKQGKDPLGAITKAIRLMSALNRPGCDAMTALSTGRDGAVHAATDVTGFGLLGHLRNVVAASGCCAIVHADAVPVMSAARTYVNEGIAPGGTHANWRFLSGAREDAGAGGASWVEWDPKVEKAEQLLLCDAQTSGGLLIAVDEAKCAELVAELARAGALCARIVGRLEGGAPRIRVALSAP